MLKQLTLALALAALVVATIGAGGAMAEGEKPEPVAMDAKVPDFTMKDDQGRDFQLYKSTHTRKEIEASVRAAATKYGAAKDCDLSTKIDDLKGVKDDDGAIDASKRAALASEAGSFYGMIASEESAAGLKTVGDVVAWIEKGQKGPIVFMCWSPRCPTCKSQNDRINEALAKANVRVFALASSFRDEQEHYDKFRDQLDFHMRVFPDRDQKITDILGGRKTPHFFLVSPDFHLKYQGALDNDAMGYMDAEERENYLHNAVEAVRTGKEVPTKTSEPAG